ncbi:MULTISPECIES: alkaline phosphatase [Intestinimonas]|uniref:alkaline phosphatase n=1 Tax=Intestinimonas TaxID=1392389 RepID=UPI00242D1E5E
MKLQRTLALSLAATSLAGTLAACSAGAATPAPTATPAAEPSVQTLSSQTSPAQKAPKYVFLFIGDGMSYPQFQAASDYLGAMADTNNDDILDGNVNLSFMDFPVAGSAVTYDSTSFCPDSASTATSISTGYKTYSGTINMDETATVAYETIAEKLREQFGWKIGVISSVNLNHATPAAFYAHQASRGNYYEIGEELVASGFEYFAGGGLLKPTGSAKDKTSLYDLAAQSGYQVVMTQAEAEAVTAGPVLIIDEHLADSDAFAYENDRTEDMWALSDYVKKGIEVLDNDTGFFMMVEGGKIDWACHANDAGSTIADTIALSDAVEEAVAFAKQHPDETLILVTGDHETGGLTIGYAGTDYDTFLTNLSNQKISYAKYDSNYVAGYKENNTSFEDVMKDVEALFGLKLSGAEDDKLVLTDYEVQKLKDAYAATMDPDRAKADPANQAEYVLYGTYEPLSVTITHLLNNKSGINFSSYAHTGLPVAVFAQGAGQDLFGGSYDNTQIYHKLADLLDVK